MARVVSRLHVRVQTDGVEEVDCAELADRVNRLEVLCVALLPYADASIRLRDRALQL
jgi:hypothetical protein